MTYDVNSIDSNESSYMEDSDSDEDATISNALADYVTQQYSRAEDARCSVFRDRKVQSIRKSY